MELRDFFEQLREWLETKTKERGPTFPIDNVDEFIASLRSSMHGPKVQDIVVNLLRQGEQDFLAELSRRLLQEFDFHENFTIHSTHGLLDRLLAMTPGAYNADLYTELILERCAQVEGVVAAAFRRKAIDLLISGQPQDVLEDLVDKYRNKPEAADFVMELLQEGIVHGKLNETSTAVLDLLPGGKFEGHPLKWLPAELMDEEADLPVRHYTPDGNSSSSLPFGPGALTVEPIRIGPRVVEEIECWSDEAPALLPFKNWTNGGGVACVYRADSPISEASVLTALLRTRHPALEKASEIALEPVALSDILNALFSAAAVGGAYSCGVGSAQGRLQTWMAVRQLVGISEEESFQGVLARAQKCQWFRFETDGNFFDQVTWDVGILCLRPSGTEFVVLAATDED